MERSNFKIKCLSTIFVSVIAVGASSTDAHEGGVGRADSHAPIHVMGDHIHKAGEYMISYRHMEMTMSGNQQGADGLSDDAIATSIANRFAGMEGMPATLRIVPQKMTTAMDMLGLMYAPSDRITLMLMVNYLNKDMRLKTYDGMMGTDIRGEFDTQSSGLGDTKLGALVSLYKTAEHKIHLNLGMSMPTGEIDKRGEVLTPMSMGGDMSILSEMRLPYAMQLGSGTYDLEPGLTVLGMSKRRSWGLQYKAVIRTGNNDAGYRLGDQHQLQAWTQYLFTPALSASFRVDGRTLGRIDGIDTQIMGPVQTADPDNYGGDVVNAAVGLNYYAQNGVLKKHRMAIEYSAPVMQDLNGVQMTMDAMLTLGYQYAF